MHCRLLTTSNGALCIEDSVPTLTDYLELKTLQQLQDAFALAARLPMRLCDADGKALTKPSPASSYSTSTASGAKMAPAAIPWCDVPVLVREEVIGRITLGNPQTAMAADASAQAHDEFTRLLRYVGLMANVISRMCDREKQLRDRAEELGTLYRLTAEFTGRRDLQSLLNVVASTVVDVLGAKSCSIRLLSEDRKELVIKAVANMSPEYLNKGPILVSQSMIDEEVLRTLQPLYIADERTDSRVLYKAEAQREGIVSALVAPMVYRGHCEGVIRVYMGRKHKFDWFETSLLTAIAAEGAAAIVNARLNEEAMHSANMRRALEMAAQVQRRMIPEQPPQAPGFQIGAMYVPSYELGGDFFDFLPLGGPNIGLAICDVVGKGVRASLLMASIRASLRAHASNIYDMSEVLSRVNRDLCEDVLTSDFATLFYGVLDWRLRRLTYCNAGHPAPLLFRGGQFRALSVGGMVIGVEPAAKYRQEFVALQGGDLVLAFTDGVVEALNFADEAFGRERLEKAIRTAVDQGQSAEGLCRHVLWEVRRFAGLQSRFDDLTLLAIKVL